MSDETTVKEIISAFAIGCLEKDNYENFAAYFQSGKATELAELGNLQNVVSLLPTSLPLETVNPELFDQLKLKISNIYDNLSDEELEYIKENTKIKKTAEINITETKSKTQVQTPIVKQEEEEELDNKVISNIPNDEKAYKPLFDETNKPAVETPLLPINVDKYSKMSSKYLFIVSLTSLIIAVLSCILLFVTLNSSSKRISNLEQKIEVIEIQNHNSLTFVANYQKFIEFMNQGNIKTITLADTNGFIASKLFISPENGKALLQIINLPKINSKETYQIWSVGNKGIQPVITFEPQINQKFIEFDKFPDLTSSEFDLFKITIENKDGSKSNTNKTVYYGGFNK